MSAVNTIDLLLIAAAFSGLCCETTHSAGRAGPGQYCGACVPRFSASVCVRASACLWSQRSLARWRLFGLSSFCIRRRDRTVHQLLLLLLSTLTSVACSVNCTSLQNSAGTILLQVAK